MAVWWFFSLLSLNMVAAPGDLTLPLLTAASFLLPHDSDAAAVHDGCGGDVVVVAADA
jgi:hypothetical protein